MFVASWTRQILLFKGLLILGVPTLVSVLLSDAAASPPGGQAHVTSYDMMRRSSLQRRPFLKAFVGVPMLLKGFVKGKYREI